MQVTKPNALSNELDRTELVLRASRRALWIVLGLILLTAATLIAHVLRPGSLLADWASRTPWLIPFGIVVLAAVISGSRGRPFRPGDPAMKTLLADEFRQANLARAQRVALVVVLVAQVPMPLLVAELATVPAVTVMSVATVTLGVTALILSFLLFDRD